MTLASAWTDKSASGYSGVRAANMEAMPRTLFSGLSRKLSAQSATAAATASLITDILLTNK